MGIIIASPVPQFPGAVTLIDRPTLPMVARLNEAKLNADKRTSRTGREVELFDSLMEFCEVWAIENQPERPTLETFNAVPATPARDLLEWLEKSIQSVIDGDAIIPKDSAASVTPTPQPEDTAPQN